MEPFVEQRRGLGAAVFHIQAWMDRHPGLSAGMTGRAGGVSMEPFHSLNCGLHVGDRPEDVVVNRSRAAVAAGFAPEDFTCAEQVHGDRLHIVEAGDKGAGRADRQSAIADTDGLLTSEKGIMLAVLFADCVPLFAFDPASGAVGLAHAGWKGSALRIAEKLVRTMGERFDSDPRKLLAAIGPAIGSCCYEVDSRVVEQFERPEAAPGNDGRFMLDLKETNRKFMIDAGVLPSNVEVSRICTSCSTDRFYSHRAELGRTGRMAAWIGWRNEVNM